MHSLNEFLQARDRISKYVDPSPVVQSEWLTEELNAEVYLKLECLQPGRSFKIRGATNAILSEPDLPKQTITASGGNHGLGVAIASQRLQIPCKVVLPTNTSEYRISLLEKLGAEVELKGEAWDESNSYAQTLADDEDTLYIHAFADKAVQLGQGTIGLELIEQVEGFDTLIASVGGGGLLSGISMALKGVTDEGDLDPIDIYAVETIGAESMHASFNAGKVIELPKITSIAKTLGAKRTTPFIFDTLRTLVKKSFTVTDKEAVEAMISFLNNDKLLVEPATSCIPAAALKNKSEFTDKKIVMVICGSNVSLNELEMWKIDLL